MGTSVFSVALTGLKVAQAGIQTTSHNISNVNTPGFSRQSVLQTTQSPEFSGEGFIGTGAQIQTIRRSYNQFLDSQLQLATSRTSYFSAYDLQVNQLNSVLADSDAGLQPALDSFFKSIQNVAANPSDVAARQGLLSDSQVLAGRFTTVSGQFATLRQAANTQISQGVDTVNNLTGQIARLNDSIARARSSNETASLPNDLLDQRDNLIRQLSESLQVTVVPQTDQTYNIFFANGQPLVVGSNSYQLSNIANPADSRDQTLRIQTGNGTRDLTTSNLGAGSLAALFDFRDTVLTNAQNQLGQVALVFSNNVNTLHQLGEDLGGQAGGAMFSIGTPQTIANAGNTGNAVFTTAIVNTNSVRASDYRVNFDGTNYTVTRLTDNTQVDSFAAGALPRTIASEGIRLTLNSGSAAAGDSFLLQPTRDVANSFGMAISGVNSIAAASRFRTVANAANTGTGIVQPYAVTNPQTYASAFSNASFTPTGLTVTFTGVSGGQPQYQVTDALGATVVGTSTLSSSGAIDIPSFGISLQIKGTPATGDTFSIRTRQVSDPLQPGDNRNISALGSIQTAKLANSGTATIQQSYGQIVSAVGNKTREVQVTGESQKSLKNNLEALQQSVSGVNLDEEAANLLKYQQAYQAAGKVIQIASDLFNQVLNLTR
ncbi:flagellar hook-associated protein FlgK [Parvibium lacunae]|nr:flagellar hook-associated protein FlgK [Parvibium lacunae]